MSALAEIRDAPGLDAYLADLEERLEQAVGAYRGVVAEVGAEALAAGGKRLRPLLVYLSTPPGSPPHATQQTICPAQTADAASTPETAAHPPASCTRSPAVHAGKPPTQA